MRGEQYMRLGYKDFAGYVDAKSGVPLGWLGPLARINVFVGATNTGKSRFLLAIASREHHVLSHGDVTTAIDIIVQTCERWRDTEEKRQIRFAGGVRLPPETGAETDLLTRVRTTVLNQGITGTVAFDKDIFAGMLAALKLLFSPQRTSDTEYSAYVNLETVRFNIDRASSNVIGSPEFDAALRVLADAIRLLLFYIPIQLSIVSNVYIPTLRSAVRLSTDAIGVQNIDLFADTIAKNYGWARDGKLEIFTGNTLYRTLLRHKNGRSQYRKRITDFEEFLADNFFGGAAITITAVDPEDDPGQSIYISIAERGEYPLHYVGDGVQAIIILMYRLFTAEDGTWFFIEEPELNLHPGLQRIFLHALAHNPILMEKNLRVFMTTHSNHLLNTLLPETSDIAVFSFQDAGSPGHFLVRTALDPQHNPMKLLGVSNSSVLLANCSIWIEGITDRKYLRAYLRAYQESVAFKKERKSLMREDIHYAFLEYAGSNLAHYLFDPISEQPYIDTEGRESNSVPDEIRALALCNRIFLLADRDRGKAEKHSKLKAAAESSQGNVEYRITPGIEVENLIPEIVLQKALPRLIQRADWVAVGSVQVEKADYRNKHIGIYLRELLGKDCPNNLVAKSGTLQTYYKNKLAEVVSEIVPHEVAWEELDRDVQNFTKNLYAFIERHNAH